MQYYNKHLINFYEIFSRQETTHSIPTINNFFKG